MVANILPRDTHELVARFLAGDLKGSLELQLKMHNINKALFCEVNPIPVKAALNLMGPEYSAGSVRQPLVDIEPNHLQLLKTEMEKYGLL